MANPNVAVSERFTKALYASDQETIRALLAPDFVLRQDKALPYGGEYKGADGFLTFMAAFMKTYEIEALEQKHTFLTDDPDTVIFEFAFRGTQLVANVKFDTTLLEYWKFRNGKIVSITPHWFEVPGSKAAKSA
jgi:ketosteroid isomerase-like protein